MRVDHIAQRVRTHPFLRGMDPAELDILAQCATPTEFDADQVIFRAGEQASGFYLIESGRVALEAQSEEGNTVVVDVVGSGEPLGWSWIFEPYRWQFDARATEATTALCFSGILLRQHRDDDLMLSHELFKRMCEVMVRRLQHARGKFVSLYDARSGIRKG
jgi:CRP/FNR family cyclic AMP-dependent transcriptional regulator